MKNTTYATIAPTAPAAKMENEDKERLSFWKETNVLNYFFGQFWSLIGSNLQVSSLALMIVALVGPERGLPICGDVAAYGYIPGMALALVSGIWLDTADKKKVLSWCSWLGGFQALALALFVLKDIHNISILEIKILAFTLGFINAIDSVNRNGIIRSLLIDRNNALRAAAVFGSLYNFSMIFGAGLAAFTIHHVGYSGSYLLNALSYAILILIIRKLKMPNEIKTADEDASKKAPKLSEFCALAATSARESIMYAFNEPGLRLSILMTGLLCMFGFSYNSIMRVIAEQMFGGGNALYSRFMGATGVGALIGSAFVIVFGEKYPKALVVCGGAILGTSLIVFSRSTDPFMGTLLIFFAGLGFMTCIMTTRSAVGHISPHEYISRMQGVAITFFFGGIAIGSFAIGHIAKRFGCPLTLCGCGIAVLILCFSMPFMPGANEITKYKE